MSAAVVSEALLGALLRASVEGALVVALVALLVRAVPRIPAGLRCGLWWAACLKLVAGLVLAVPGGAALELAVLPPAAGMVPGFAAPRFAAPGFETPGFETPGFETRPSQPDSAAAMRSARPLPGPSEGTRDLLAGSAQRRSADASPLPQPGASPGGPARAAQSPLLSPAAALAPASIAAGSGGPAHTRSCAWWPTAPAWLQPALSILAACKPAPTPPASSARPMSARKAGSASISIPSRTGRRSPTSSPAVGR